MSRRRLLGLGLLLALVTCLCFLPVLRAGFVNLDDPELLAAVARLAPDMASLRWMFTTFSLGHYQPLTWLSLAVDCALWGNDPLGFHLTNLLLHVLNAVLFFALARQLLGRTAASLSLDLAAFVAALVFAIHPLRVESVAWVTERRDVLAGAFYLAAVLVYVRRAGTTSRWLALVLLLEVLSLLCKAWAGTLPLVLLLLDVSPLRRWRATRSDGREGGASRASLLLEKLVLALPAFAFLFVAALAQRSAGVERSWIAHGFLERTLQAAYGLCFYPWKTLWPLDLSPLYPLGAVLDASQARWWLACGAIVLLAVAAFMLRRRFPAAIAALLAASLACALVLAPVLGFFQSGPQLVADRYSYIATMPLAVLAGAAALQVARRTRHAARTLAALAAAVVLLLGPLTFAQTRHWHDAIALWTRAVELSPDSYFARYDLGKALLDAGRADEAVPQLQLALANRPPDRAGRIAILQTLAAALANAGRIEEAFPCWEAVLARDPLRVDVLVDIGRAHELQGRNAQAVQWWERARSVCAQSESQSAAPQAGFDARYLAEREVSRAAACERARQLLAASREAPAPR